MEMSINVGLLFVHNKCLGVQTLKIQIIAYS